MDRVTPGPDDLSSMLEAIRVRSVVYCRSDLGAPWGFRVVQSPEPKFHLILSGTALLSIEPDDDVGVAAGDLVLLPQGSGHTMSDRSTSRVRHLDRILQDHPVDVTGTMHYGGRGHKTLLVCGAFETTANKELLSWLPRHLVLDTATNGLGRWLDPMLELVRGDSHRHRGEAAVLAKVADVFLTDVLRHYLVTTSDALPPDGYAAGADPVIAEALTLMHGRPGEPWTIATLARQVGLSRSSFAARFRTAIHTSPIAYLARLRLAQAAGSLATSTRPLAAVARAAGYDNESSFSKAFARHYGEAPGQYRRRQRGTVEGMHGVQEQA
jgi:AraC-like DNA-binding protein/mannose-6-phosphate isomerase-like protein (cupin superfamily)